MTNNLTSKPLGFRSIYKIIFVFFFVLFFLSGNIHAEKINPGKNIVPELVFLDHLLKNNPDIIAYIDAGELAMSNRLGITYADEPVKFLINYNIPAEIKNGIINDGKKFQTDVLRLEDDYTVLKFFYIETKYSAEFYFKDGKCIAPVTYFTRNYTRDSSDFFNYFISNPVYFNSYSKQELDMFAAQMLDIMMFNEAEKDLLAKNKITYVLCDTETEIAGIIGQTARGIYLVANDAVVTTYNTHYHEVSHLLMNYKIKTDVKPAHLFFLEGFATAFGGRGGLSSLTLMPVGQFSISTGFIDPNSLLSMKNFVSEDASITYPVAGYYSLYLFLNKGFDEYLKTYLKYSGNLSFINNIDSSNAPLPLYQDFINSASNQISNPIVIDVNKSNFTKVLIDKPDYKIYKKDEDCLILLKNNLLLKSPGESFIYQSRIFSEKFPGMEYKTYKYLIEANQERVAVYDLFTNNLIYAYNKGFDMKHREVKNDGNYFMFSVPIRFFGESIQNYEIEAIE